METPMGKVYDISTGKEKEKPASNQDDVALSQKLDRLEKIKQDLIAQPDMVGIFSWFQKGQISFTNIGEVKFSDMNWMLDKLKQYLMSAA